MYANVCSYNLEKLAHCGFNLSVVRGKNSPSRVFTIKKYISLSFFVCVWMLLLFECNVDGLQCISTVVGRNRQWRHFDTNHSELSFTSFHLNNEMYFICSHNVVNHNFHCMAMCCCWMHLVLVFFFCVCGFVVPFTLFAISCVQMCLLFYSPVSDDACQMQ